MRLTQRFSEPDCALLALRGLCHELRPSMAALAALVQALEQQPPEKRRSELAGLAAEHAAHAQQVLREAAAVAACLADSAGPGAEAGLGGGQSLVEAGVLSASGRGGASAGGAAASDGEGGTASAGVWDRPDVSPTWLADGLGGGGGGGGASVSASASAVASASASASAVVVRMPAAVSGIDLAVRGIGGTVAAGSGEADDVAGGAAAAEASASSGPRAAADQVGEPETARRAAADQVGESETAPRAAADQVGEPETAVAWGRKGRPGRGVADSAAAWGLTSARDRVAVVGPAGWSDMWAASTRRSPVWMPSTLTPRWLSTTASTLTTQSTTSEPSMLMDSSMWTGSTRQVNASMLTRAASSQGESTLMNASMLTGEPGQLMRLHQLLPSIAAIVPGDRLHIAVGPWAAQWPVHAQHTRQILINLVGNAARHTTGAIHLGARLQARRLRLTVADEGGPTPDLLHAMRRSEPPTGDKGFGLWLVRHLAARHGGRVRARPVRTGGLAMEVLLPRYRP